MAFSGDSFYVPLIKDLSIFDNIIVDEHSVELLEKGAEGQRYAVVGFFDEDENILYLHCRPTFPKAIDPNTIEDIEERKKYIEEMKKYAIEMEKFAAFDIVRVPKNIRGAAHSDTIDSVQIYYKNRKPSDTHVKEKKVSGLSFIKSKNSVVLNWIARSTLNYRIFDTDPIAEACFHFPSEQNNFVRPEYLLIYHLQRTLPDMGFNKIKKAIKDVILKRRGQSETEEEIKLQKEIDHYFAHHDSTQKDVLQSYKQWNAIKSDKTKQAQYMMRTIFYASGMLKTEFSDAPFQPTNFELIEKVLNVAKEHKIPLNLNDIPHEFVHNDQKQTAIMQAIIARDLKSTQLLADYADFTNSLKEVLEVKDSNHMTPLHLAITLGNFEIAKYLLGKGAQIDQQMKELLFEKACVDLDAMKKFELHFGDVFDVNEIILKATMSQNIDFEVIEFLLEKKPDLETTNELGETIILQAAKNGGYDIVDLLIESKANIEASSTEGLNLQECLEIGAIPFFKYLLQEGRISPDTIEEFINKYPHIDFKRRNASGESVNLFIMQSFLSDSEGLILLEQSMPALFSEIINITDAMGNTPLMNSILENKMELMQYLIEHKSSLVEMNDAQQTATAIALINNNFKAIKAIQEAGVVENISKQILMKIKEYINTENKSLLSEMKFYLPNIFDTMLMLAIKSKDNVIIDGLLKFGETLSEQQKKELTPTELDSFTQHQIEINNIEQKQFPERFSALDNFKKTYPTTSEEYKDALENFTHLDQLLQKLKNISEIKALQDEVKLTYQKCAKNPTKILNIYSELMESIQNIAEQWVVTSPKFFRMHSVLPRLDAIIADEASFQSKKMNYD